MERTLEILGQRAELRQLIQEAGRQRVLLSGVAASAAALAASAATQIAEGAIVLIAPGVVPAADLAEDITVFGHRGRVLRLPLALDGNERRPEVRANYSERLRILEQARSMVPGDLLIVPAPALLDPVPRRQSDADQEILRSGERLELDRLIARLDACGLGREGMVTAPGEFSVRGDIIDIFPFGARFPTRIELWDDRIESIREFDPDTQLSRGTVEAYTLPPLGDPRQPSDGTISLAEALPPSVLQVLLRPHEGVDAIEEAAALHPNPDAVRAARTLLETGVGLVIDTPRDSGLTGWHLEVEPAPSARDPKDVGELLEALAPRLEALVVLCSTDAEARRFRKIAQQRTRLAGTRLATRIAGLSEGFVLPDLRVAILNHHELYGRRRQRRQGRHGDLPVRAIEAAFELVPGDYVVHAIHGIARYQGEVTLERDGVEEDFLVLEFDGGTLLYVPSTKIELVQRYIGAGGARPKLDRIGGRTFARKKQKVADALEDVAAELLEVQAARSTQPGCALRHDDPLLAEFEQAFPFEETQDQTRTAEEVRRDLSQPRPMDRLLCGDVGFGKTEIAMRAAFTAVLAGKQVAVLVPTTLLAQQHLETFRDRFTSWPLRIEALSRLVRPADRRAILEDTSKGQVDILIGTHRLLSRDVRFRDLGLLVIDEEQRFGVKHKERLKRLRRTIDVLTLTATPIPRTLHMALTGLRDISSLRTPPEGRRPIRTEVHYRSENLIAQAVQRELTRGGQVYIVRNRIDGLDAYADRLRARVPHARIATAHGQMTARVLETTADRFTRGAIDVLVCTTIIESGIDIPTVNTLIVDRADRFGLADLHQLRGRVGRSDVQAYAYFLVPRGPIGTVASKRLRAIESLSHLGAGFDLSLRDLEIRGAGNLLGREQHGHIAAVGYDLYCRLLAQAVKRLKGEPASGPVEPETIDIELPVSASMPALYIPDPPQRMEILRRLGRAEDSAAVSRLEQELRDRFGRLPKPATRFLDLIRVRNACRHLGIRRIFYSGGETALVQLSDAARFQRQARLGRDEVRPVSGDVVRLVLPASAREPEALLEHLRARLTGGAGPDPTAAPPRRGPPRRNARRSRQTG